MKSETYDEAPGLGGDFPGREKQGATHASREWPWMATPGLRAAGTAQRNVFPQPPWTDSRRPGKSPPNPGAGA